ncbi:MAG: NTP-binding protein [Gammaproteobacteria bacterium]|nr:MAG: NTP-binding protein [Gammaproteobacteria bacterium]
MSAQFKSFEVRQTDLQTIVVVGDIDASSVVRAREEGEMLLRSVGQVCTVDLTGLGPANSVVMSMLLCWIRLASALSVELCIINETRRFSELCRVNGLDRILFGPRG